MKKKEIIFRRNCPKCNRELTYCSKVGLEAAYQWNFNCKPCSNRVRKGNRRNLPTGELKPKIRCRQCGETTKVRYKNPASNNVFCSTKCWRTFRKNLYWTVIKCKRCLILFSCRISSLKYGKAFCSKECADYWRVKNVNRSAPEIKFAEFLTKLNVEFASPFLCKDRYFDFKIDNTLIEIDGTYWHGKGLADEELKTEAQIKSRKNDKYKNKLALQMNYELLRIWDEDLDEIIKRVESLISCI